MGSCILWMVPLVVCLIHFLSEWLKRIDKVISVAACKKRGQEVSKESGNVASPTVNCAYGELVSQVWRSAVCDG